MDDLLDVYEACRFLGGNRPINPATLWRGVKAAAHQDWPTVSALAPQRVTSRHRPNDC